MSMSTVQRTRRPAPPSGKATPGKAARPQPPSPAKLGKEAVQLALNGEWRRAVELNRAILAMMPDNCEAANRLAKALIETGELAEARAVLRELLSRHPTNTIALKNDARLDQLESAGSLPAAGAATRSGLSPVFIEEGGKSCTATLRRPDAPSNRVDPVAGDEVTLSICAEGVMAQAGDGAPVGLVESRLGRRLRKLMAGGNRYSAAVIGTAGDEVSIIIREVEKHPSLRHVVSFLPTDRKAAAIAGDAQARPDAVAETGPVEAADATEILDPEFDADPACDAETEATISALVAEPIDEDADEPDDADDGIPVLDADTDDVGIAPPLAMVAPVAEDWE